MKFELNLRKRNISKEELIADLQKVAREVGQETITASIYTDRGKHGVNTMLRKFGSWNDALREAGLLLNNRLNIPDEELFENLADVWQHLGRQPYGREMKKVAGHSKFSLGTYEKRFGSWNNALVSFIEFIEGDSSNEIPPKKFEEKEASKQSPRKTPRKINWRLRAAILIRDNCICKMCGTSPAKNPDVTLHIDHIIPYSKGGETLLENLRTLCSQCNIGKSDMMIDPE